MTAPAKKVFITVNEVFDRTEAAYRKIIEYYRRTGKRCMDPRTRMLLNRLIADARQILSISADYRNDASAAISGTRYQFTPEGIEQIEERISWPPDTCLTVDGVLSAGMMVYSATIDFFQQLSQTAPTQPVEDIFRNLASVVLEKKKRAARNASEVLIDM